MNQVNMIIIVKETAFEVAFRAVEKSETYALHLSGEVDHVVFSGWAADDEGHPGEFHKKNCTISFIPPRDEDWLVEKAEKLGCTGDQICGFLVTYEELSEDPAIESEIWVLEETFRRVTQAIQMNQKDGLAVLKLKLGGVNVLSDDDAILPSLRSISDLDISEQYQYAIHGFDITKYSHQNYQDVE